MKILVANSNPIERRKVVAAITTTGNDVLEAHDFVGARNHFVSSLPEVVFVEWSLLQPICELIASAARAPYVIVSQAHWTSKDITAAYARGAHDFIKLPAFEAEVIGRVDGFKRMQAWFRAGSAGRRDFASAFDLGQVRAWRELEALLADEIGVLVGGSLRRAHVDRYEVVHAGAIALVLATEQLEVRLSIGADRAACAVLAERLLGGDQSNDALADALREMSNTAGGALKRAALADGLNFTLGLPNNDDLFSDPEAKLRWTSEDESGLCLAFAAKVVITAPKLLPASNLREGMVIVRDLKNAAGLLLASAGTLLTRSAAERLGSLAGGGALVEIANTMTL